MNQETVTEREMSLQRIVAFAQRILTSNQDCIKVLDLQARLLYMNEEGQTLMEIDDFEGNAKHAAWLEFWQGGDRKAAEAAFNVALAGGTGKFDGYCATAKGTPKWWEVVVSPIRDSSGQISEILSASRDITARKLAEAALEERNQELEVFARIVSHDLKAPLRGVASLSDWIREDLEGQVPIEIENQLDLMGQRVRRMEALIDGLLKYARCGEEKLDIEPVDVNELLEEIVDSLSLPAGFEVLNTTPLPTFLTKRLLLSQVLTNLISNAVKHHDREQGSVHISVRLEDCRYEFVIADDGPGIPVEERDRVFEVFRTLKNNCSTTNTGIGLALVKKIMAQYGL